MARAVFFIFASLALSIVRGTYLGRKKNIEENTSVPDSLPTSRPQGRRLLSKKVEVLWSLRRVPEFPLASCPKVQDNKPTSQVNG